jgi:ADP-heptose:LPS heptosyltransferase
VRVKKLVVFRGLYLGDLVSATGALRAIRRGYPGAEITLVSLPWASTLAPHIPHIDRFLPYPGATGLDGGEDEEALEEFLARMGIERFDLAVNMHGRGPTSTRLVTRFGARRTASFVGGTGGNLPTLDVEVPWDAEAHESRKLLLLAKRVGGAAVGSYGGAEPELGVRVEDYQRARALLTTDHLRRPLALVHPGASLPEKRWAEEAFGRVAKALIGGGYAVAVTGNAKEKELTRRVAIPGSSDLGGRTDLATLIGLVAQASLVVSNDTGPAHLAYALKIPSVTIFGPSTNVERWGPLNRERHAVLYGNPISEVSFEDVLCSVEVLGRERERSA